MTKAETASGFVGRKAPRKPASKTVAAAALTSVPINKYFLQAYHAGPMERVDLVRRGVPASVVPAMARRMAMPKEKLVGTLGLARATIDRKVRDNKPLSRDESSRVLGMARLVGQVQAMVEESGDPAGFDAAAWVARWLERPLPALGGQRPAELMDTPEGQSLVSNMVARMQSGAYS